MLKRILIFLLALCCCVPALADTYQGYNYDAWGESVPAPQSYLPAHSITLNETGKALKNPSDVFVWQEKLIYISDSGNNRIVVLDASYQLLREIAAYESDEGSVALKNPTGIFVDQAGLLYICLPDEGRVVVLDEGNLLHPALMETYAAKAIAALDQQDVQSLSPLTLPDSRYGSYSKNRAYPEQTQQAAEAVLAMLAKEYSLVLERPNAFALPYADFVTDVPGDFSRFDVLDETVPFLQLVYSGMTGYAGEIVNLSADPDSAVLHAIATGEALHYELITGNAELLIDTDLNTLFSARPELWLPHMKAAAIQVAQARHVTENTRLMRFEWLSEGVSVSTFENGVVLCVNDSDADITWQGQNIPAGAWMAGKEAAE